MPQRWAGRCGWFCRSLYLAGHVLHQNGTPPIDQSIARVFEPWERIDRVVSLNGIAPNMTTARMVSVVE
jgi:hypothetical protein